MSQLPQKVVQELGEAFFLFDYDKDKKITSRELGAVIRSVGLNPTEGELKDMVREVDNNSKGLVDINGVCQLLSKDNRFSKQQTTQPELSDAFGVFDKNGDGMVSIQDLKLSLTTLGERLTDEEIDQIIREVDQDGEGQLRIEDVTRVLLAS